MGGGEILKKGWLIKSPPLEGGGIKVSLCASIASVSLGGVCAGFHKHVLISP